jgi:hypothetical protein
MSLPIHVDAYSGHRANERPLRFWLDTDISSFTGIHEVEAIEGRWYEPGAEYFKVRTNEGKRYILRYSQAEDEWALQSGFDGDELLQRPGVEVLTVDTSTIRAAEQQIASCEHCRPGEADWLFSSVLDDMTGRTGNVEYVMAEPAKCPNCRAEISEKTLVQLQGGVEVEAHGVSL